MVIAKNVKEAVNGEVSHFTFRAVSEFFGLLDGTIQIDDNVSQLCFFLRDVLLPFIQCKGEDIGRCIDIAVVAIQLMDGIRVTDEDADLCLFRHLLQLCAFGEDGVDQLFVIFVVKFHITVIDRDFHGNTSEIMDFRMEGSG